MTLARSVIQSTVPNFTQNHVSHPLTCASLKKFSTSIPVAFVYDLQLRTDPVQKKKGHQSCTLLVEFPIWSECVLFLKYKNYSIKMTTLYRKNNSYIAA